MDFKTFAESYLEVVKNEEARRLPNLSFLLVELNGIELGTSRFRPSACRYDRSPFGL